MPDSVLYSAELPAFDRATGQLSLAAHHLISAPLSFLDLSPPGSTLLFDQPPAHPYQQPVLVDDQPRRKRRRTALPSADASPADFAALRDKRDRQTTTDRESDEHHAGIALDLRAALEAVQQGWAGRARDEGWVGARDDARVQWRLREAQDERPELDLVGLAAAQERQTVETPVRLEPPRAHLSAAQLFNRLVLNDSSSSSTTVDVGIETSRVEPAPPALAALLFPPRSGFLMSDLSTWSAPSSGIAALGHAKGGWDVVVIESVPARSSLVLARMAQLLNLSFCSRSPVRPGPMLRHRARPATKRSTRTTSGIWTFLRFSVTSPLSLRSG